VTIRCRPAALADLRALAESEASLNAETAGRLDPTVNLDWPDIDSQDGHAAHLEDPAWLVLVADEGGTVVGHLAGFVAQPPWRTVSVATIFSMHVAEGHRGAGVGSALVAAFRAWACDRAADVFEVSTYTENKAALQFYRRHGFQPYTSTLQQSLTSEPGG
jgi:GNAT superfamily N-acetyltransferase